MFIAHVPAGFLLTHWLQNKLKTKKFLWVGLLTSIFPDIDIWYFYLVDDRQTLHHHYWTHLPLFWIVLGIFFVLVAKIFNKRGLFIITIIALANIILHLVLDSIVGGIKWLYPFIDYDVFLFTVTAKYHFWIWNFILHWTFLFEITIIIAAGIFLYKRKNSL